MRRECYESVERNQIIQVHVCRLRGCDNFHGTGSVRESKRILGLWIPLRWFWGSVHVDIWEQSDTRFSGSDDSMNNRVPDAFNNNNTGWPKNWHHCFGRLNFTPNINKFPKLFHCQNQEKMCSNAITKDPTTPQMCHYTTLWNVKCLKSNNWKQDDFCNNTF